jgi:hypothetical protein
MLDYKIIGNEKEESAGLVLETNEKKVYKVSEEDLKKGIVFENKEYVVEDIDHMTYLSSNDSVVELALKYFPELNKITYFYNDFYKNGVTYVGYTKKYKIELEGHLEYRSGINQTIKIEDVRHFDSKLGVTIKVTYLKKEEMEQLKKEYLNELQLVNEKYAFLVE